MITGDHWPNMTAEQSVAVMFIIGVETRIAADWCRSPAARALPLADAIRLVTKSYLSRFYDGYGIVFDAQFIQEFMGAARNWLTMPLAGNMEAA